jgi:hypothetical protein
MSFFSRLFGNEKNTIECPRCLGKGHVDRDDIKRLKQELKWAPGSCAYCNGKGKVTPEMVEKLAVDTTYLTNNLSLEDRQKIFDNDPETVRRLRLRSAAMDNFIQQVLYLHNTNRLAPDKIAEFFLLPDAAALKARGRYEKEMENLVDFINRAIEFYKNTLLN